ncbi:MAG: DUF3089 domain-containing protein [Phascolarctobacterium sp.]|nr:DUF3089 domain-containing protein [Phascolarctobacterium sp.]
MQCKLISALAMSMLITANCFAAEFFADKVDYANKNNWAFFSVSEDKPVDVFIVCPTVDMGQAGNFNADITDEKIKNKFIGALNMEKGIYEDVGRMFSPFYRQAAFTIYSKSLEEQEKYLLSAYSDVSDAFKYYMANINQGRPVILAGFSQGSDMTLRLMKEFYGDKKYREKLVAAYCIGWRITKEEKKAYPQLKVVRNEKDNGRIILFNTESEGIKESIIIPANTWTYAVNPLNWKHNSRPANKNLNIGACFMDYKGNIKKEIPKLTGAYIDKKRGSLIVPDIKKEDYPPHIVQEGIYHVYDYQFFYRNLKANVKVRTESYLKKHKLSSML